MQRGPSTKEKLLELAKEPVTYTELKSKLGISDPVIQTHLKDLQKQGLLIKTKTAKYILTESGELTLEYIEEQAEVLERHSVVSAFFDAKGKTELSRLDKASLKADLREIDSQLADLMIVISSMLANGMSGDLPYARVIDFPQVLGSSIKAHEFLKELYKSMGMKPSTVTTHELKSYMNAKPKPGEDKDAAVLAKIEVDAAIELVRYVTKRTLDLCVGLRADFEASQTVARMASIFERQLNEILDSLRISEESFAKDKTFDVRTSYGFGS